ncbi:hemagglutinin repeat-containing protein [Desulfovibrio desulfuricans]|uniref:hemagglutinin repeat-containing protein n=1 Tax=Desulfovibrio desulfuricans TaxID=876 RepID=UPI001C014112|nr:hemagglutinin repeat-containing protein [Desulfovibrio desulfuricans]
MEHRTSIHSVALCAILSAQLILSPIFAASAFAAGGVTPDPNAPGSKRPSMDVSANGVPLVNITAPNSSGLSHNQYSDFNVHQQGLILNNSYRTVTTQIGGIITGNPNFHGDSSREASTILNEVTSANRSRIEGYIEVGGRPADVILANPNGITVNGGGFINVPRATLSTGVPQVNPAGALTGHEVQRGDISIEGAGINADNTDAFTLLARTASVEAQVRGKNVTVVAGRNNIATDGTVTPLADDPANPKPQVAIDSSALGGMYANRITLVATEKGVGVNLEGTVQSADQMVITADGKLRLREASSGGDAMLASNTEIRVDESAAAAKSLGVSAPRVSTPGVLAAGENLSIQASALALEPGARVASGVDSSGGLTQHGKTTIVANTLEANQAKVLSGGSVGIAVTNTANVRSSTISVQDALLLTGGTYLLSDSLVQGQNIGLDVRQLTVAGKSTVEAYTNLAVKAALMEVQDSVLRAAEDAQFQTGSASVNATGSIAAGNGLVVTSDDMILRGGFVSAGQDVAISSTTLSNIGGVIYAARDQQLATAGLLLNDGGEIYAGRNIAITYMGNTRSNIVRNISGTISAGDTLSINAATVENKKREFEIASRGNHVSSYSWHECNAALLGHGCDRRQLWYYVNEYNDYILKDSPSSQMLAGGDIIIGADFLNNEYSTIAAGKNLSATAGNAVNKDGVLQHTKTTRETMKGWDSDDDFTGEYFRSYKEEFTEIGRSPAVFSANSGLYMNVSGTFSNLSQRQGISQPNSNSASKGYPFSGSPMFHAVASPGHHYLIVTDPRFTNLGNFYGSDYFLSRVGLDQKRQQVVLLGDAFYETRLVQQQILESTGRRFLGGYSTDADQMRGLMDAAVAQQKDLNLTAGVALTAAQAAALTQDMVWLVEEEYMGQKVLVPHVYLASATREDITAGGGVQAKNVYINAGKGVLNEGIISGGSVNIASVDISNTGGLLRGGDLNLTALNNISNNSGFMQGTNIAMQAGNNITSQTLTTRDPGNAANIHVLAQAGIEAKNSVTAVAGNDVSITGSTLNAGGDIALQAGRNMTVGTVTEEFHMGDGVHSREDRVTHTGSAVAAGGNLTMTAASDMTVAGSQVVAGGNAVLAAGKSLSVVSVQDSFSSFVKTKSGNGGLFSSSSKKTVTQDYRTNKASTVGAGGNLTLAAGVTGLGHATVVGSNLVSAQDLSVLASGNINVVSGQNSSYFASTKSTTGALGLSSSSKASGSSSVTQVASNLLGQNITLDAGKSVGIAASNFIAQQNLSLTARNGDVSVLDAANQSASWSYKKQTGFGLGGGDSFSSFYGTEGKREQNARGTSVGSNLAAGQDITVASSRDTSVVGSSLSAGNNVTINAGRDANILGGTNTSSSSKEKFSSGFGVGGTLGLEESNLFVGYQNLAKGRETASSTNAASTLAAGNTMTVNAGQNVNMSGSGLKAGTDLGMTAGKDIHIAQATNTESISEYERSLRVGLNLTVKQNATTNAKNIYNNARGAAQADGVVEGVTNAKKAVNSAAALPDSKAEGSLTVGVSSAWSSSESHKSTAVLSELSAGRDMALAAGQDVSMQGTQAQAERNITIAAGRDLTIHAAESSSGASSASGKISASVGIGAKAGKNGVGFGYQGNMALGGESADNDTHEYNNAKLLAGETLSTSSGQDTTIAGANLTGKDVSMTVGRNLNVSSLQNSASSSYNSYDITAGATVGGGFTADASLGVKSADGSSRTVGEQTSILGSNSVNIYTENNTHIAGAVIAAINDNLKLNTGTLSYENVVGKTTQTSTGWGINWHYETEDKAANNKGNAANKGNNGDANPSAGGQTAPKGTNNTGADKTDSASAEQDKEKPQGDTQKEKESNKYEHLPQWAGSIFKKNRWVAGYLG